jgi:hypothetical protein
MHDSKVEIGIRIGRLLHHEANFSHYHNRRGDYIPCSGIECDIPIFVLLLAIFAGILVLALVVFFIHRSIRYRKAFEKGNVPAKMLISGHLREAKETGKEEPDAFTFIVHRRNSNDERQESECPVCLKTDESIKYWLVMGCSHQICEKCFYRLVSRLRLHARCPLCRQYLAEGNGNRGPRSDLTDQSRVERHDGMTMEESQTTQSA